MSPRLLTPVVLLALTYAIFLADLLVTAHALPDRIAVHFDAAGNANGWMTRSQHIFTELAFGTGLSLLFTGIFYAIRFLPPSIINIPNRDFWLAPERRAETNERLLTLSFWLASLVVIFFLAIHHLIIAANAISPPRLDTKTGTIALAGFLAGMAIWIIALYRRFPKPK